jgi:cell surface protein SprA
MSTFTWGTAFFAMGKGEVKNSEAFEKFKTNRIIIAKRLASKRVANATHGYNPSESNPETGFPVGYGPTSIEVMVPAFLAAYQNRDPYKVSLGMFPSIRNIRPNWRISYDGVVSQIPALNKVIKSLNFTHSYRSTYNVGSFLTNLNFYEESDGFSYMRDIQDNFIPGFEFNSVSIMESFSPLINIDIMWVNDLTTRGEIKRSRNMTMSFANNQLTEVLSNEYIFGLGYRFTHMDLIIKTKNSQQSYSNDLNITADFSIRNNKTILRKLVEDDNQITAGMRAITIKTTADYMLSDRFQLRVFFDKIINRPFTSISFPTSNTNFGVSFRFTLAQ